MLEENTNAMLGASEMSTKFAISPELFDAAFGGFQEFLDGVARHVGLPATNRIEGMGNNFCHGNAAHEKFTTSNYWGTQTTAAEEFEFVVKTDLNKEYAGKRRGISLIVYLLAAGAARCNDDKRLNMPFAEIAGRFDADMLDSVQTEVLRKAKEAFMMAQPLQRAADELKSNSWNAPWLVQMAGWSEKTADDKTQMLVDNFSIVAGNVYGSG